MKKLKPNYFPEVSRIMNTDFLKNIDNSWTLFLDRDGVINKRIFGGYVTNPSNFEFLPGVLESISTFAKVFGKIIVVTNQQGVGKGLMTESELNYLHNHMKSEILKNNGRIDSIYYCTDLAHSIDNCRKPSTKMAKKAQSEFPSINFSKSIMVGDSKSDIEFGKNSEMKTVFIGEAKSTLADITTESLVKFKNLLVNP